MKEALMKRTILVVLMAVLITTPCLAQEVETDGILSIEGTRWDCCGRGFATIEPFIIPPRCFNIGFYKGRSYRCTTSCRPIDMPYIDSPVLSIAYYTKDMDVALSLGRGIFVMQPSGIGFFIQLDYSFLPPVFGFGYIIGTMLKTDDNLTPSDIE